MLSINIQRQSCLENRPCNVNDCTCHTRDCCFVFFCIRSCPLRRHLRNLPSTCVRPSSPLLSCGISSSFCHALRSERFVHCFIFCLSSHEVLKENNVADVSYVTTHKGLSDVSLKSNTPFISVPLYKNAYFFNFGNYPDNVVGQFHLLGKASPQPQQCHFT